MSTSDTPTAIKSRYAVMACPDDRDPFREAGGDEIGKFIAAFAVAFLSSRSTPPR